MFATLAMAIAVTAGYARAQTVAMPSRLSDSEFWRFIVEMSEPDGYFSSNNFVSNETMFQHALPNLIAKTRPGHVYLGVGPEQNLTYIANLKPSMAIIIDIRRGNMHMHLMYKALFELSATRAEFVSRLFSKPMPPSIGTSATAKEIFDAIWYVPTDSNLYRKNFQDLSDQLLKKHGFALSASDMAGIRFVYDAFYYGGPILDYGGPNSGGGYYPSYMSLMTTTDGQVTRSYLASEENFRFLKDLHSRNMFVPVIADFAGPKTIRAVGAWLKARNARVQAFYTSNVEQYLWQSPNGARNFYANVATLPLDSTSMYIRGDASGGNPAQIMARANRTCSILDALALWNAGAIDTYYRAMITC